MLTQSLTTYKQSLLSLVETQAERYVMHALINNLKLPQECRTFLDAEVQWWAYTALLRKDPGHRFPIDKAIVFQKSEEILSYYHSIAECNQTELRAMIEMFVDTYANSLFRPLYTLTTFIYRNDTTKTAHEILLRSTALNLPMMDMKHIISKMIDDKQDMSAVLITKEQFEQSCSDALRSSIGSLNAHQLIDSLNPLLIFLETIGEPNTFPVELLQVFFKEAGLRVVLESIESSPTTKTYTREELLNLLASLIGDQSNNQYPQQEIFPKAIPSRTYFGAKGIMLITGDRLSLAKRKLLLEREVQVERESQQLHQDSKHEIERLLRDHDAKEQPLRLMKRSFLGTLPMHIQVHYANAMFAGDVSRIRKLGASIDKTVGVEAALATCKAFINKYGNPERESEDPMKGLCDLIEVFCKSRDN